MSTVDIAMATYNGENFISEQIDSIINQSYQDWKLYISDDGSSDNTVEIIKTFVSKDKRIELVNTERQGGVISNFNKSLKYTTADFIMLSDQDDIWPSDRLKLLLNTIQQENNIDEPKLVFSDLTLVNEVGGEIAKSFYKANNLDPLNNLQGYNLLWNSTVYGCTTIMNRALLNLVLPVPNDAHMHDQWLAMKAHQYNGLIFLDTPTVMYRQHSSNVVGGINKGMLNKIKDSKNSIKAILLSVKKTKNYMKNHKGLYFSDRSFDSSSDFLKFAKHEILPYVLMQNRKVKSLVFFIGFVLYK